MEQTFTRTAIEQIYEEKFYTAANVQLLWRGQESFDAIFNAVKNAEKIICLEFYIFRNDETGTAMSELLKQKSGEGVKVYVLYDHLGSIGTPRKFWKDMKKAGIKVRASRPFKWTSPFHYVHRDHKKLIVIDFKKAFTGGLNIANEYSGSHLRLRGKSWRDTGIMVEGPIVYELFKIFRKTWHLWGGEPIEISNFKFQISNLKEGILAIPIFVSSAKGRRRMRRLLYYSINRSKKSISLTIAYFVPSKRMIETLGEAVKRGVRVRLLVPGKSDIPAASYAGRAFFSTLLKAGVEIYTYDGEILHAKSYIFDECWSIIGSTNLDFQSFRYNDEGNIGILDTSFASKMKEVFEEDILHSVKISKENWDKRPVSEKLKEKFFSMFRRRL
jgi:cardiolipin synthase